MWLWGFSYVHCLCKEHVSFVCALFRVRKPPRVFFTMVVDLRNTRPVSVSFFLVLDLVSLEYREEEMGGKNEKFSFKNNKAQINQRNPS